LGASFSEPFPVFSHSQGLVLVVDSGHVEPRVAEASASRSCGLGVALFALPLSPPDGGLADPRGKFRAFAPTLTTNFGAIFTAAIVWPLSGPSETTGPTGNLDLSLSTHRGECRTLIRHSPLQGASADKQTCGDLLDPQ
jgi:hypothetical protein